MSPVPASAGGGGGGTDAGTRFASPSPGSPTSRVTRALFWIAGAEERHMRGLKKERVFFQLVGGSVVLTAVAAAVGMLLFQRLSVPGNWFRDIAIALLWATFIFWIDRWLVSYVPYGRLDATNDGSEPRDKGWRLGYAARFLLGLVLAFVISGPITLAVFNPEIQQQLIVNQNEDRSAAGTQIRLREDFLAREKAINGAVADAELTEKAKNEALRVAQAELDAEVAGRNGTGEGCGALCDAKTTTRDNARTEATTATTAAEQARSQARIDRAQLEADIQAAIANSDAGIAAGTGALARERALFTLLLSEPYLLARWAAFTALLLLIDLAPILFKLVGSRSSLHDFVVRQEAGAEAERVRRERKTQRLEDDADHDVARLDIAEQTKLRKENIELDSEAASVDARDGQDLRIEQNSVMLPWLPRALNDFIMQGLSIDATRRAPGPDVAVQNALDTLIAIENRIPRDVLDSYVGQHQVVLPWPPSGPGGPPKGGGPGGPPPSPGGPPPSSPGTQSTASE